ncbi:MAG: hypothetical protein ACLQU3_16050 [Limisphaerales bacterium]
MKISSIPKSGRTGSVVYFKARYGYVARQHVCLRNPRTADQQFHRDNVRGVARRWRTLASEQRGVAARSQAVLSIGHCCGQECSRRYLQAAPRCVG